MTLGLAHTMQGGSGPADWPRLTAPEVTAVLAHWGLRDDAPRLRWHSPRPLSSAAIVEGAEHALFIKRHAVAVRTAPQLAEEHGFMQHLREQGAAVSQVIAAPDGRTAQTLGGWTYEVHALGLGLDLYRDAPSWTPFTRAAHAEAAGRALGRLHAASRGYAAPPRATELLVSNDRIIDSPQPLASMHACLERRAALHEYFAGRPWETEVTQALAPHHAAYAAISPRLARLWTHNDLHASNLLWSDSGASATVTTIFDFGLCDETTAAYDLATAIERNAVPWLAVQAGQAAAARFDLVTGLLTGYLAERPLAAVERAAVAAVLPIVHIGYALTEVDYFQGITHSSQDADLAYEAFLLGHCAWFLTPPGRALLAHVRGELARLPGATVA
jgi:Ser/Thr protein kinase RdoA (MazF antagonist)